MSGPAGELVPAHGIAYFGPDGESAGGTPGYPETYRATCACGWTRAGGGLPSMLALSAHMNEAPGVELPAGHVVTLWSPESSDPGARHVATCLCGWESEGAAAMVIGAVAGHRADVGDDDAPHLFIVPGGFAAPVAADAPRLLSASRMADPGPASTWEEWSKDVADTVDAIGQGAGHYPPGMRALTGFCADDCTRCRAEREAEKAEAPAPARDCRPYASEAERHLGELHDIAHPGHGRADPDARVLAAGLAAIANAVLSLDEAVRSGAIDTGNALGNIEDVIADAAGYVAGAIDAARVVRRPWWRRWTR